MRRNEVEQLVQSEKNYITNPKMQNVSPGTDVLTTNYAANPSFTGTGSAYIGGIGGNPAGWTTSAMATDKAHSGTRSYKLGNCVQAGQAGIKAMTNPYTALKVLKGQKVSWSCWVYSTVAGTISPYWEGKRVSDNSYTGGGSSTGNITLAANVWTYVYGTSTPIYDSYVEGAGAYNLAVNIGDSVWFDDFCITATDTPVPYFDGDSPAADGYAYSWTATPYASPSTRKAMASIVRTNLVANPSFRATNGLATVRTNLLTNPSFEASTGITDVWTNNVMNPAFRATNGTITTKTNLITNPSFESSGGTGDIWTNLATNPSFEAAGALLNTRTNYVSNPSFEASNGLVVSRTNQVSNTRGITAYPDYSGAGNQTITANVPASGNPDGITTANRVTYTSGAANPGIAFINPAVIGTTYAMSAWVYHETVPSSGSQAFAHAGVGSMSSPPAIVQGVWQRIAWVYTATTTVSQIGFRVASPVGNGSFLITGLLVENINGTLPFFDGATASTVDYTYSWTGTPNASTSTQKVTLAAGSAITTTSVVHQSTDWYNRGAKSLRITPADNTSVDTFAYIEGDTGAMRLGMVAGKTYTISGTVRLTAPQTGSPSVTRARRIVLFYRQGTGGYLEAPSNAATNVAGTERVKLTFTLPSDTTEAFVRVYNGATAGNGDVWWDDLIVEEGTTNGDYFDGSNPLINLCTNSDFETSTTGWTAENGATLVRDSASISGGGNFSAKLSGAGGDAYFVAKAEKGMTYTFSLTYKNNAPLTGDPRLTLQAGISGAVVTHLPLSQGVPGRYSVTLTAPASGNLYAGVFNGTGASDYFYFDNVLIEQSPTSNTYYSGAGDYTYAWLGTANASASVQQAPTAASVTGGNVKAVQSSAWAKGTGKSIRLIPMDVSGSNATSVQVPVTLTAGKTYTVLATRYIDKPITGTLNTAYAGRIALIQPSLSTLTSDTVLPNVVGEGTIRWTFTVDASATGQTLRLGHGGIYNSGEVWWDKVLVVEGVYNGYYFDGSTPAFENLVKIAPNALNGGLTHTTGVSFGGSTWTRATAIAGTGSLITRQYVALSDLSNGDTYTTSVTVANDQSFSQSIGLDFVDNVNAAYTLAPGEQRRISVTSSRSVYDTVFRFSDLQINQSSTEARSILFKDWLIEKGTTNGEYYATTGDFTYGWNGTVNASTSYQRVPTAQNWLSASLATAYQTAFSPKIGTKCGAILTRGGNGDGTFFADLGVTAGTTYTSSAWVKTTSAHRLWGAMRFKDAANGTLLDFTGEVTSSLVIGSWVRVSVTSTAPANATKLQTMWRVLEAHTPTTFYLDGAMVIDSVNDNVYFDGSTPVTQNLFANSAVETALGTTTTRTNYATNPAFVGAGTLPDSVLPYAYLASGTRSLSGGVSTLSATTLANGHRWGAVQYITVPATSGPVTVSIDNTHTGLGRSTLYVDFKDAGGNYIDGHAEQSRNSPGSGRLTATVNSTSQGVTLLVYWWIENTTGADIPTPVSGSFSNLLVEIGNNSGVAFNGNTAASGGYTYGWNGTANASTSRQIATTTTDWSYWAGGSGSNLGYRLAADGFAGPAFFRVIWNTSQTGSHQGGVYRDTTPSITPGESYSARIKARTNKNQTLRLNIEWLNAGGKVQSTSTGPDTAVIANVWSDLKIENIVAPTFAVTARITLYSAPIGTAWLLGDTLDADAALFERSTTASLYYDGTGDFTYAWSGTAHASTSIQKANIATGSGASKGGIPDAKFYTYQSIDDTGKKIERWFSPAGSANSSYRVINITNQSLNYSSITAGNTYTLVMRYRSSGWGAGQTFVTAMQDATSLNTVMALDTAKPLNTGWTEYRKTFTALLNGASSTVLYIALPVTPQATTDGIFDISDWALVPGVYTGPVFDGSSAPTSSDFTVAWTGAADASISKITAPSVTGTSGNYAGRTSWQSNDGPTPGKKSVAIMGGTPNVDTFVQPDISSLAGVTLGGKTFTILATRKTTENYNPTGADGRAWRPHFTVNKAGGGTQVYQPATVGDTTAGIYQFRYTFTFDSDVTTPAFFRLYNGSPTAGSIVWWDDVAMIEGSYADPYFDGSTPASGDFSYAWAGAANTSTSYQKALAVAHYSIEPKIVSYLTSTGTFKAFVKDPNGGGGRSVVPFSAPGVNILFKAGTPYTIRMRAKKLTNNTTLRLAGISSTYVPLTTSMADYSFVITPSIDNYLYLEQTVTDSGVEFENLMILEGAYTGSFFDGATAGSGTMARRWSGTADASTSQEIGAIIAAYTDEPNVKHYKIDDGAMRVVNIIGNTTSLQTAVGTLDNGKKHTILIRAKSYNGGQMKLYGLQTTPSVTLTSSYAWYRVIATASDTRLYLSTQGGIGGAGFDISHMLIAKGRYDGNYFDGDYPNAKWVGNPNNSTSVGYAY